MTELGPQHICMHGIHLSQPCQECANNEVRRQAFCEVCVSIIPAWHMSFCPGIQRRWCLYLQHRKDNRGHQGARIERSMDVHGL